MELKQTAEEYSVNGSFIKQSPTCLLYCCCGEVNWERFEHYWEMANTAGSPLTHCKYLQLISAQWDYNIIQKLRSLSLQVYV